MAPHFTHDAYTIGWISALPVELAAAAQMLDETHARLPQIRGDQNIYRLGRIGDHNVVMACLAAGRTGIAPAAAVALQIKSSFPKIRFGLMVGVAAGVPTKENDIRLGDVVISTPENNHAGVIQYDYGKTRPGEIEHNGHLDAPPEILLSALNSLRANHWTGKARFEGFLSTCTDPVPEFSRQKAGPDILYDGDCRHGMGITCQTCTAIAVTERKERDSELPEFHYGTIASGNQVIRDSETRDKLSREFRGVLAFEMEAAGLMNNFPCIVIRGICDYADSHKNKKWQPYAAAAAAAYAKDLLMEVPVAAIANIPTVQEAMSNLSMTPELLTKILGYSQMNARHADIKSPFQETCRWILSHQGYRSWATGQSQLRFLWIKGHPGAGKSTLLKFLDKESGSQSAVIKLSFYFNARGYDLEKSAIGMYRSLLSQFLHQDDKLRRELSDYIDERGIQWNPWTLKDLEISFKFCARQCNASVRCFIDALDECDDAEAQNMIELLQDLAYEKPLLSVCFASRYYPTLIVKPALEIHLDQEANHIKDIEEFVDGRLAVDNDDVGRLLKRQVVQKASSIFFWVVLVVPLLNQEIHAGRVFNVQATLDSLPSSLIELLERIANRTTNDRELFCQSLRWILFAARPLFVEEYYFAMTICLDEAGYACERTFTKPWNEEVVTRDRMSAFVSSSSRGLADVVRVAERRRSFISQDDQETVIETVQFIHESVRDFLLTYGGLQALHPNIDGDIMSWMHEKLTSACYKYLAADFVPQALSDSRLASQAYPFLEYSATFVLHHAEAAAVRRNLDSFLKDFNGMMLSRSQKDITGDTVESYLWSEFLRMGSDYYQINRHTWQDAKRSDRWGLYGLMYVLAAFDKTRLLVAARRLGFSLEGPNPPLIAAAAYQHPQAVRTLLRLGACIQATDQANNTALLVAFFFLPKLHDDEMMRYRDHDTGMPKDMKPRYNVGIVDYEAHQLTIIGLLLAHGASTAARSSFEESPLWQAIKMRSRRLIMLLLRHGAAAEVPQYDGQTAFQYAADKPELLACLLEHNVNRKATAHFARSLLRQASAGTSLTRFSFGLNFGGPSVDKQVISILEKHLRGKAHN